MASKPHPKTGKHTDNWERYPVPLLSTAECNASYDRQVKGLRAVPTFAKNNGLIKKFGGKNYYAVTWRKTQDIRDFIADNYRDAGFSVRVQGDVIYARRK